MSWSPEQYLKLGAERLRPARDLLARVEVEAPVSVIDLGCGTGAATALLRARWPEAEITAIDSAPAMLARARKQVIPDIDWVEADVAGWRPGTPAEVIYSNAALHWLDDHAAHLPRLLAMLRPGGWLALQMPRNFAAPSHRVVAETVRSGPWRARLEPLLREQPVAAPEVYYRLLAPGAARLDIWQTEYLHRLQGENPVLDWIKGAQLVPLLSRLDDENERAAFLADCGARLRAAYPPEADGATLFHFRRLFIVARS